jgi:hypothetical protein
VKFRQGYLGPHFFLDEVVISGMVHGKLRLGAQKMSISTIPHNHIIWVPPSTTRNYTTDFVLNVKPLELYLSDIEWGYVFSMAVELHDTLPIT